MTPGPGPLIGTSVALIMAPIVVGHLICGGPGTGCDDGTDPHVTPTELQADTAGRAAQRATHPRPWRDRLANISFRAGTTGWWALCGSLLYTAFSAR